MGESTSSVLKFNNLLVSNREERGRTQNEKYLRNQYRGSEFSVEGFRKSLKDRRGRKRQIDLLKSSDRFSLFRIWHAEVQIGCGRHQKGRGPEPFSYAAGMIGLGRGPFSLISQIGSSVDNIFSYCLGSIYNDSTINPLILGTAATYGTHFRVTPLLQNKARLTFYYLSLHGISVADKLLPIPKDTFQLSPNGIRGLIIDSGMTIMLLVEPAYKVFNSAVISNIQAAPTNSTDPADYDLCYNATSDLGWLPTITFHFAGGAKYFLPQNNSFVSLGDLLCLAFNNSGLAGSMSIFGNVQQH